MEQPKLYLSQATIDHLASMIPEGEEEKWEKYLEDCVIIIKPYEFTWGEKIQRTWNKLKGLGLR